MLKIGMIVGSTRPERFADTPAKWLLDGAAAARVHREAHGEIASEIIAVDVAAVEAFLH